MLTLLRALFITLLIIAGILFIPVFIGLFYVVMCFFMIFGAVWFIIQLLNFDDTDPPK